MKKFKKKHKLCLPVFNQIERYKMVRRIKLVYKTVEEALLLTNNRYREIRCIKMYQQQI